MTVPPKKPPGAVPLQLVAQLVAGIVRLARSGTRKGNRATLRDGLAVLLGLHSLRIREVSNLNCGDLRPTKQGVWVRTLKGGLPRLVPLSAEAWQLAAELAAGQPPEAPLCRTSSGKRINTRDLRRRWAGWVARVLSRHFRFHDLRHTAIHLLRGLPGLTAEEALKVAQLIAGHRKESTTVGYLVTPETVSAYVGRALSGELVDRGEPPQPGQPPEHQPAAAGPA